MLVMSEGRRGFCVCVCPGFVFAVVSPEPAHLEASPSLCPQFHRGQIDFDSVRTDRQTGTDSATR